MMVFISLLLGLALHASGPERINADWLEGCWEGAGFGSPAAECWMTSPSGRLTGVFQLF